MKRLLVLLGLLAASGAHAATFQLSFLLPTSGNRDTTCTVPNLSGLDNTSLRGHWRWWVAGGDSTSAAVVQDSSGVSGPGATITTPLYNAPLSLLRAKAWVTDGVGSISCDTLMSFVPFKIRPWRPHKL